MNITREVKFWYYIYSYICIFLGEQKNYKKKINALKAKFDAETLDKIQKRVDYYCKINSPKTLSKLTKIKDLKSPKNPKSYYFDAYEYARFFEEDKFIDFLFGDVIHVPSTPSIVKSRPIVEDNENSVLLKLDKVRHFVRINNDKPFENKKKYVNRARGYLSTTSI